MNAIHVEPAHLWCLVGRVHHPVQKRMVVVLVHRLSHSLPLLIIVEVLLLFGSALVGRLRSVFLVLRQDFVPEARLDIEQRIQMADRILKLV